MEKTRNSTETIKAKLIIAKEDVRYHGNYKDCNEQLKEIVHESEETFNSYPLKAVSKELKVAAIASSKKLIIRNLETGENVYTEILADLKERNKWYEEYELSNHYMKSSILNGIENEILLLEINSNILILGILLKIHDKFRLFFKKYKIYKNEKKKIKAEEIFDFTEILSSFEDHSYLLPFKNLFMKAESDEQEEPVRGLRRARRRRKRGPDDPGYTIDHIEVFPSFNLNQNDIFIKKVSFDENKMIILEKLHLSSSKKKTLFLFYPLIKIL